MGYTTQGSIENYWPDDDDNTVYIPGDSGDISLESIILIIRDKWPNTKFDGITISSENIHTTCLTYDLYDSSDYTQFVIIRKN